MPYPLDAGAKVYSAKLAESLASSGASVTFMGIDETDATPPVQPHITWATIRGRRHGTARALLSPLPNAAAIDAIDAYKEALAQHLRRDWDAVILDGYGSGWALKPCIEYRARQRAHRSMLVHISHNHEERLWRSMAHESRVSVLRRLALWQNYCKVRALERSLVRSVDLLTTITDEDRASLGAGVGEPQRLTLMPGYDGWIAGERQIRSDTPRRVILMGSFRWIVKQENLARFVELADPVFARHGIELDVVGEVPEELLVALGLRCQATRFHGFVTDVSRLFDAARVAVVPEAIGGGFKLKFLDYFFGRVPVATLAQAAAGLPQDLREQTLARDSLSELIEAVVAHIERLDELNRMQEQAFALSRAQFAWPDRGRQLREAIMSHEHA